MLLIALFVACGGDEPTWYGDVKPISDAYCADCHTTGGIAPFELNSAEHWQNLEMVVQPTVSERVMPPYYGERGHTPLKYDTSLSNAQIATIEGWYEAGAPLGNESREGEPIVVEKGGIDSYDIELQIETPYEPQLTPDDYHCFVFDWPETEDKFVTGFEVLPDNPLINHHIVAYAIPPYMTDKIDLFESMDEGDGYTCFGSSAHSDWVPENLTDQMVQIYLGAWTPGTTGLQFTNGQKVEPGSKVVLQVHYYTEGNEGEVDQSAMRLQLSDSVEQEAFYMPWLNILWPAGGSMLIPAGETRTHSHRGNPIGSLNVDVFAGGEDFSDGMLLHSVFAHMHVLGRSFEYLLHRADGTTETLLSVPYYDFNWQQEYVFETPVQLNNGDELEVRCTFDNTAEWAARKGLGEPEDSDWGEGSLEEMCVAHTRITHIP